MNALRPFLAFFVILLCLGCLVSTGCRKKGADSAAGSSNVGGTPTASSGGLDGTWKPVSVEISGEQVPIEGPQAEVLTVISGNRVEMKLGNRTVGQGTITVDNNQQPKTIDMTMQQMIGKNSGRTEHTIGIYEVSGDTLRLCIGDAAKPRPTEFRTDKSSARKLSRYRRVR